jgi:hypothetical protein
MLTSAGLTQGYKEYENHGHTQANLLHPLILTPVRVVRIARTACHELRQEVVKP